MGVKIEKDKPYNDGNNRYGYKIADVINMCIDATGAKIKPATLEDGMAILEKFFDTPKSKKKR